MVIEQKPFICRCYFHTQGRLHTKMIYVQSSSFEVYEISAIAKHLMPQMDCYHVRA